MYKALLAVVVVAFLAIPASLGAQSESDLEADIRAAMSDSSKVLVIVDSEDLWAVFPVTGISEVAGNKVTVKAGTFVIADCQSAGSPKKQADKLLAKWKSRKGENYIVASSGGMQMITFFFGELKEVRTFEVKKVVLKG
jgi:hypothetical protein